MNCGWMNGVLTMNNNNNDNKGKTTELFFDFTMSDDNDLLAQVKEAEEKSLLETLDIASPLTESTEETRKKATESSKNESTNNMHTNISIDLTDINNFDLTQLDDLVKETEELIETISETVQETAKISAHQTESFVEQAVESIKIPDVMSLDKEIASDSIIEVQPASDVTGNEDVTENEVVIVENELNAPQEVEVFTETVADEAVTKVVEQIIEDKNNADVEEVIKEAESTLPVIESIDLDSQLVTSIEDERQAPELVVEREAVEEKPYVPYFISEEVLQEDTGTKEENEQHILEQTGSFLFNSKDLHTFKNDDSNVEEKAIQQQVEIEQTISPDEMLQISAIVENLVNIKPEIETIPEESISKISNDSSVSLQESNTLDIDDLLKRLDEISEKEMLHAVAPKENNEPIHIVKDVEDKVEVEKKTVDASLSDERNEEKTEIQVVEPKNQIEALMENIIIPKSNANNDQHIIEEIQEEIQIHQKDQNDLADKKEVATNPIISQGDTKLSSLVENILDASIEPTDINDIPAVRFSNTMVEIPITQDKVATVADLIHEIEEPAGSIETLSQQHITFTEKETIDEQKSDIANASIAKEVDYNDTVTTLVELPIIEEVKIQVENQVLENTKKPEEQNHEVTADSVNEQQTTTITNNEMTQKRTETKKQPKANNTMLIVGVLGLIIIILLFVIFYILFL